MLWHFRFGLPIILLGIAVCSGCATTGENADSNNAHPDTNSSASKGRTNYAYPEINMELESRLLYQVVRQIGEEFGGGLVLMDGVAERQTPDFSFKHDNYGSVVEELSKGSGNLWKLFQGYYFIYPEGYEELLALSLEGKLDERYAEEIIGFSVGANNRLYNVLNLLGHSLGLTIVADNFIADARCGELTLHEVPLVTALEAVLRSARVPQDKLLLRSTENYIFLGTEGTANRGSLVEDQGASYLDKHVNLYLPRQVAPGQAIPFYHEITTLGRLRNTIEKQLGVPVSLDTVLEKVPVNPCIMNDVTVRDALNLLLWQWPVEDIRCIADASGIRFVVAGQPVPKVAPIETGAE